jgi:hypothetical protein
VISIVWNHCLNSRSSIVDFHICSFCSWWGIHMHVVENKLKNQIMI